MKLDGKVAIVTGAASGIGQATALALAGAGASVIVCDMNLEGGTRTANEIKATGGKSLALQADISKIEDVDAAVKETIDAFGRIDILVNCAAYLSTTAGNHFHEEDTAEWDRHINITLKGTLYFCKAVIPHMIKDQSGRIINVTSAAVKGVQPGGPFLYPGCKAAIAAISKGLAADLARYGILVNCVAPGPIKTTNLLSQPPEYLEKLARPIPLKRMGEPEEVADMILFLASDRSRFVTGQHISVDGGLVMA